MKITFLSIFAAASRSIHAQVICPQSKFCLYASHFENGTSEFTLETMPGFRNDGYIAFGLGFDMFHAQIYTAWVHDEKVVFGRRTSFYEGEPEYDIETTPNTNITSSHYFPTNNTFRITFVRSTSDPDRSFTFNPTKNNDMIWSIGHSNPGSADPSASMKIHNHRGPFTANFFRPTASYASMKLNGITIPTSIPRFSLFTLHGMLMFTAWLVLAPIGIILTRLLRPYLGENTTRIHAVVMSSILVLTMAGVVTALIVKHGNILINTTPTAALHVCVGFALLLSSIAQGFLGGYVKTGVVGYIPGFWGKVHALNGKALFFIGVSNVPLGMFVYNQRVFVFSGFWYRCLFPNA